MESFANTLVIDADVPAAQLIAAILVSQGAEVAVAADSTTGMMILQEQPIEVLFSELHRPDADASDLLQQAFRIRPRLAAVALTCQASLETALGALRAGACDYVTKPVDRHAIVSAYDRARHWRRLQGRGHTETSNGSPIRQSISLVAASSAMQESLDRASHFACTIVPVLISGEAGVGKQLLSEWIHLRSPWRDEAFMHVNCHALQSVPPSARLMDWVRMGTSDVAWKTADDVRGTVFLEHITALPLWAQRQLLAEIEQREMGINPAGTRLRVMASTISDLETAVDDGHFDRGLFHYLNIATIRVPPLRERPQDITALVAHFIHSFRQLASPTGGGSPFQLSDQVLRKLIGYPWPGNVRELKAVLARSVVMPAGNNPDATLGVSLQRRTESGAAEMIRVPTNGNYQSIVRAVVGEVVRRHGGNKAAAARALGIHRRTLYRVLERGKSTRLREI